MQFTDYKNYTRFGPIVVISDTNGCTNVTDILIYLLLNLRILHKAVSKSVCRVKFTNNLLYR